MSSTETSRSSTMARPETLIPGNCYFSVHFYDNDLVLPMIDTLPDHIKAHGETASNRLSHA